MANIGRAAHSCDSLVSEEGGSGKFEAIAGHDKATASCSVRLEFLLDAPSNEIGVGVVDTRSLIAFADPTGTSVVGWL